MMNAVVQIDDYDFTPALLTGEDVLAMTSAGVLPEGRGFELIEGVLVRMAAQYDPHVKMVALLLRHFGRTLPDDLLAATPSVFLSEQTMLEPDVAVCPITMKSTDIRGPDLILAIEVSDTTLRNDLGKKAKLYAAHGVSDYWVIDVTGEQVHLHMMPGSDGYAEKLVFSYDEAVALPDRLDMGTTLRLRDFL